MKLPCKLSPYKPNAEGYARKWKNGKCYLHHRLVCEETHGPCPEGMECSHLCDTALCIEPTHLVWETPKENNGRKSYEALHHSGALNRPKRNIGKGRGWRYDKRCPNKPYRAEARVAGRLKFLGGFATAEEARAAYLNFSERRDRGD